MDASSPNLQPHENSFGEFTKCSKTPTKCTKFHKSSVNSIPGGLQVPESINHVLGQSLPDISRHENIPSMTLHMTWWFKYIVVYLHKRSYINRYGPNTYTKGHAWTEVQNVLDRSWFLILCGDSKQTCVITKINLAFFLITTLFCSVKFESRFDETTDSSS